MITSERGDEGHARGGSGKLREGFRKVEVGTGGSMAEGLEKAVGHVVSGSCCRREAELVIEGFRGGSALLNGSYFRAAMSTDSKYMALGSVLECLYLHSLGICYTTLTSVRIYMVL